MTSKVDFDPTDPIWDEIGDMVAAKFHEDDKATNDCPHCGGEVYGKRYAERYLKLDMECVWKEWTCSKCGDKKRSLFYWRQVGGSAPMPEKIDYIKRQFQALILEFRRHPFWQQVLSQRRWLAEHYTKEGRAYITIDEAFEFMEQVVLGQVYLEDGSPAWPDWADEEIE